MKRKPFTRIMVTLMALVLVVSVISVPTDVQAAAAKPTKITLKDTRKTIYVGDKYTISIKSVTPRNASKSVSYKSSNEKVATVDAKGRVTARSKGTATITATSKSNSKVKANCKIKVNQQVKTITVTNAVNKTVSVGKGRSLQLRTSVSPTNANNKKLTYTSKDRKIATVTSSGKITGKKAGKTTITIKSGDGKASTKITVIVPSVSVTKVTLTAPSNIKTLDVGNTVKLTAIVTPNNATVKTVSYKSDNEKIAAVDAEGNVKAIAPGTAKITATTLDGGKTATYTITVNPITVNPIKVTSITLTAAGSSLAVGETLDVKATVKPDNAAYKKVTWNSSDKSVATVDANGKVAAIAAGTTKITAKAADGSNIESNAYVVTVKAATVPETENELSYDGYELKWEDQFEGDSLNRDDWNVELHDPGWVNNELQAYVDSSENIYIEDGKLVIKPVKTEDENGNISYTSGRVNTQNKHDYKYGLFEARIKVPEGQGFLPAFWMMPTNENLYGQWPRCGEIDIMEVLGNKTDTSYGTIHYGNPHSESQGSYTLKTGNFAAEYHDFAVEWEPGKISWYVDGKLIHTESDWYSATEGQGEITYPAPFDQSFYMILNLAVGGNWPGNPDETTDIEKAALSIDYVKVYQKDSYDENVTKPVKEVILRDPDVNGNYIINGNFAVAEDLTDDKDWKFLTALGGEAEALINNNELTINTTREGTANYSVQMVQADLPMKKGATYRVSFDAYADEARSIIVDVSAPDRSYRRYLADTTVELTTEKQTYTYEFTMKDNDDANGRLEFNLGAAGTTASVKISNVSLIKTGESEIQEDEKGILADGNYVYNGGFQEGADRMIYWEVTKNAGTEVSVTNVNNIRRLKVVAAEGTSAGNPVIITQRDLALSAFNTYAMSFMAEGEADKEINVEVAGHSFKASLTGAEQTYNDKFKVEEEETNRDIVFIIEEPGTFYLDDIRIVEDSLIKNGSFNAGFAGYESFVDGSASATYVVDSLTEDNAADFTISNTGDAAWKIQLKQNNIELEKGQWYRLSLDAKSNMARKLMFAIQRDGSSDDDWTPYSGEKIVDLSDEYQTYEILFQMKNETDLRSILSISMGAVGGIQITERHRICIDNINLEKVEAPETPEQPLGENILKNSDFAAGGEDWDAAVTSPGEAIVSFNDNKAVYAIANVGTADWNVQLKQAGITLEKGCSYRITFKVSSTEARTIKLAMLSQSYDWYGGEDIALEKDQEQEITVDFTMNDETDMNVAMVVSMGLIDGITTPVSTVCLSEFSLVKTE